MPPPQQTPSLPTPDLDRDEAALQRLLLAAIRQDDLRAVLLTRPDGTICWANPATGVVFGHDVGALVGRPLSVLFLPDDVANGIPELECMAAHASGHGENDRWMMRADGSAFWATGAVIAVRDDDNRLIGYMKLLRNRTDLREHTLSLRSERDALIERVERVAVTVAKFAHELRTPLSTVSNAAYLLQALDRDGDGRVVETAELLQRQVERMTRLLDDMPRAVRVDPPRPLQRTCVLLQTEIIEAVAAVATDPADRERIDLVFQAAGVELLIDRMHLQQMLTNLIGNAVKYTPDGQPIWVRLSAENSEAVVRVEDRGIGIAPDVLADIFDLFTRGVSESAIAGSGIGLAVVKELVTLNGGTVLAQSEGVGTGAIFTLRLPLVPSDNRAGNEARLVSDASRAQAGGAGAGSEGSD